MINKNGEIKLLFLAFALAFRAAFAGNTAFLRLAAESFDQRAFAAAMRALETSSAGFRVPGIASLRLKGPEPGIPDPNQIYLSSLVIRISMW